MIGHAIAEVRSRKPGRRQVVCTCGWVSVWAATHSAMINHASVRREHAKHAEGVNPR